LHGLERHRPASPAPAGTRRALPPTPQQQQFPVEGKKAEVGPRKDDGQRQEQATRGIVGGRE
jgi:hypothetical protein